MTPEELKRSIIQYAIQGKMVPQLQSDEDVDAMLVAIKNKREKLISEKKLKVLGKINKRTSVELEIPDNWRFVCLSELICKRVDNRGKTPPHSLVKNERYCIDLLEINAIIPGASINHANVEKFIDEETYLSLRGHIEADDILIATVGSIGKFAMMDSSQSAIAQNIIAIKCFEEVEQKYIFYLLQSSYFYTAIGNITMEAVQASIKVPDLMNLQVPLPPLAEQKRIVAKLEEILPLIERYESAWNKLESFNKRFPGDMQKSILQLAIQGKLVEQRSEEGTGEELFQQIQAEKQALIKAGKIKKEKPLPEIVDDEIPFDVPDGWKWIRLGSVVSVLGGKRIPAGRTLTTEDTGYKYIRVSDMKNGSVLVDNLLYVPTDIYPSISKYIINKEDIYLTVAGTIGRVGKIPEEIDGANLTENADRLVFQLIDQDWLIKCLESSLVQQQIIDATTKVGQPKLAIWRIQELLIPLPPLAEQKRIVAKLEEILPLCDRLK